jgi:hypothetical protein
VEVYTFAIWSVAFSPNVGLWESKSVSLQVGIGDMFVADDSKAVDIPQAAADPRNRTAYFPPRSDQKEMRVLEHRSSLSHDLRLPCDVGTWDGE